MRRIRLSTTLLACAFALLVTASGVQSAEPASRTFVVLVDVSTSMDDIMPAVQEALGQLVNELHTGDRLLLYGFGDRVQQRAEQDITTEADRVALRARIADLQPTDRFTDITSALGSGMRSLRRDARQEPGRIPVLILLTDGRHNPSGADGAPTFDEVLRTFADFEPGSEWFLHYIVLRDDAVDADAESFVRAMRGAYTLAPSGTAMAEAVRRLPVPVRGRVTDVAGACTVRQEGAPGWRAAGPEAVVETGSTVETGRDGRAVVALGDDLRIGLDLGTTVDIRTATWDPLGRVGEIRLYVHAGAVEVSTVESDVAWTVDVETPSGVVHLLGTRLRVEVDARSGEATTGVRRGAIQARPLGAGTGPACGHGQQVALRADNRAEGPVPIAPALAGRSAAWDAALEHGATLTQIGPELAAAAWAATQAHLGPAVAGGTWREEATVWLVGLRPEQQHEVSAEVRASLPSGLHMTAAMRPDPSGASVVVVEVTAAESYVPEPGQAYAADVLLVAGDGATVADFPARVWTAAAAPVLPPPRTTTAGEGGWLVMLGFAAIGALLLLFVYGVGGARLRGRGASAAAPGRLLLVDNPVPQEVRHDFVRLEPWAVRRGERQVSIGRNTYCDIVLPHPSVAEHHCNLEVWRRGRQSGVNLQLVKQTPVSINGTRITSGPVTLVDRLQVGIGKFTLQYEDSAAKPQVIVHLRSGEAVRGALHSWDMTAPNFSLAPDDPDVTLPGGPIPDVAFADVEDIAMLAVGGKRMRRRKRRKNASRVAVRFHRGRKVRGELWADYRPDAPLFALFPDDQPDVDYLVVVRANTRQVVRDGRPERT